MAMGIVTATIVLYGFSRVVLFLDSIKLENGPNERPLFRAL